MMNKNKIESEKKMELKKSEPNVKRNKNKLMRKTYFSCNYLSGLLGIGLVGFGLVHSLELGA